MLPLLPLVSHRYVRLGEGGWGNEVVRSTLLQTQKEDKGK